MGTSKTQPNDWMLKDGTGKSTVFGDERGWVRRMADGQEIVIHAMSGVNQAGTTPEITLVVNPPDGNYSIASGDVITFNVTFSEEVIVTGIPIISFNENGVSQQATYNSNTSTGNKLSFDFAVTIVGNIDTVVTTVALNGGTIQSVDGINALLTFPANYTQPTGIVVVA